MAQQLHKVKYHNDLNTIAMRKWTPQEMNLFFSILAKAKNKGSELLHFDTDELKELTQYSKVHNKRWEDTMSNSINKMAQLTYMERNEKRARTMTLFSYLDVDFEERVLDVQVSKQFEYIINELSVNFTSYELAEFVQLRSSYAKTAYRLLKQWRTLGKREFTLEEFTFVMDTPKSYRPSEIKKRVLTPILEELQKLDSFRDLKVKTLKKNTKGTPVTGYLFTWKPEKTEKWLENKYAKQLSQLDHSDTHYQDYIRILVEHGVFNPWDKELIGKFKAEVFPYYNKLLDKTNIEQVESHIGYVSSRTNGSALGFFKTSIRNYLKRLKINENKEDEEAY